MRTWLPRKQRWLQTGGRWSHNRQPGLRSIPLVQISSRRTTCRQPRWHPASSEIGDNECVPLFNKNAYLFSLSFRKHEPGQSQCKTKTHSSLFKGQEKGPVKERHTVSSFFVVSLSTYYGAFHSLFVVTLSEEMCKFLRNANFKLLA